MNNNLRCLCITAATVIPFHSATAQSSPEAREEIVVTATRSPINLKEAPASVSVIDAVDIERMTIFTIDEALKNSVGLMNRRTKGFMETTPSLTIRGFSNARDNLLLVDGIPQNDSRNGQINWTMIDVELVDRIEVVRGPFSSLYGSNAMGGVVSVVTRRPTESGISIKAGSGGSLGATAPDDTQDLSLSGTWRVNDTLSLAGNLRQRSTNGYASTHVNVSDAAIAALPAGVTGARPYRSNIGSATNLVGDTGDNWYDDDSVNLRLSYSPSEVTRLDLSWADSSGTYGYDSPHSLLTGPNGEQTFANISLTSWLNGAVFARGGSVDQTNIGLTYSTRMGDVGARLSLGHIEKSGTTVIVGGITQSNSGHSARNPVTFQGGDGRLAPANDTGKVTADLQLDWAVGERHELILGVAGSQGDIDEKRWSLNDWSDPGSRYFLGSVTQAEDRSMSLYVQDMWSVTDTLTAYVGARQDWWEMKGGQTWQHVLGEGSGVLRYKSVKTDTLGPKLSLVYLPQETTSYRFSVGKAFRPPNLYEFFGTAQIGGDSFVGNPDLEAETAISWELGIDHDFRNGINLVATAFYSELDDMIQTISSAGLSMPQNTSEAEIRGYEVEMSGSLPFGLLWSANYTRTDTEVTDHATSPDLIGKALTHAPRDMYNLSLQWSHDRWDISASHYYQSKRYTRADNADDVTGVPGATDSFVLTDAKVSYALSEHYSAALGINNIFDEEYRQFYLSPGRSWFAEFRVRY